MNTPEEEKWIVSFLKELYFERKKNENKDLGSEEVSGETESTKSNEDEDEDKFEEEFDEDREALNRHSSLVLKVLQEEKKSSPLLLASHESPHFRFRRNKTTEDLNEDHEEEASESSLKFLEQLLQLPLLKQIFSGSKIFFKLWINELITSIYFYNRVCN